MLLAMAGKADSVATELCMEDALEAGLEETKKNETGSADSWK
jgi:hypothetical protein